VSKGIGAGRFRRAGAVIADPVAVHVDEGVAHAISICVDKPACVAHAVRVHVHKGVAHPVPVAVRESARVADVVPVLVDEIRAYAILFVGALSGALRWLMPTVPETSVFAVGIGMRACGVFRSRAIVADSIAIVVHEVVAESVAVGIDETTGVANPVAVGVDESVARAVGVGIFITAAIADAIHIGVHEDEVQFPVRGFREWRTSCN
jgi:hypothetical protein